MLLRYISTQFILWSVPVPPAAKQPHNMILLVRLLLRLASLPLFPTNITMVIMAKQFYFVSSDQRTCLQIVRSLSTCAVANSRLVFYMTIWSSGFFLAERHFRLCRYRTRFIDTFVPVSSSIFTSSFAVFLGLICTFRTKVRSTIEDRTRLFPERYDGCVVPRCLYLHTIVCTDERGTFRCLVIAPKDEPDLWRSTII
jgi:hypothetical protein